jgi:hypothetical protein
VIFCELLSPADFYLSGTTMHLLSILSLASPAILQALSIPQKSDRNFYMRPPAFFLAGDSTTAPNGGWGDEFLPLLKNGATGKNFGHSGATTSSFKADGDWGKVLAAVNLSLTSYRPYVTIQVCGCSTFTSRETKYQAD